MNIKRGFTLLELLVVLLIVVIAISMAAPSYRQFVQHERHAKAVNSLQSLYKYARSEAVKRETTISIGLSNRQLQVLLPSEQNRVLRSYALPAESTGIQLSGFSTVTVQPRGTVSAQSNWNIADSQGVASARCVQILLSGQLLIEKGSCANS